MVGRLERLVSADGVDLAPGGLRFAMYSTPFPRTVNPVSSSIRSIPHSSLSFTATTFRENSRSGDGGHALFCRRLRG